MKTRGEEYACPDLNELAMDLSQMMVLIGFEGTSTKNVHQKLLLAVGEIVEAQEELREGRPLGRVFIETNGKPTGFPTEIADAIIRLLSIAHDLDIDISAVINQKSQYNLTRPYRHGRAF